MAPEEESQPEAAPQEAIGSHPAPRRDRRGARGRRGRGRGRGAGPKRPDRNLPDRAAPAETPATHLDPESVFELAEGPAGSGTEPIASAESRELAPEPALPPLPAHGRPAPPATVQEAIDEVSGIVDALRTSLEEMEEVLELLEMFERQKNADEREIESLRRAVRQMHRPREGGQYQHR